MEDVRAILQTYEGMALYPIMISNIIREIRKRDIEQKNKGMGERMNEIESDKTILT